MNREITIQESRDVELIWSLVHDPSVFNRVCDDGWLAKPLDELKAIVQGIVTNPANHIPVVFKQGIAVGCFIVYAIGNKIGEVHTFMSEKCRGRDAIEAGKMAMREIFLLPEIEKLISFCPENIPESYSFAKFCGWKFAGIANHQWVKDGKSYSIKIVEISKQDLKEEK